MNVEPKSPASELVGNSRHLWWLRISLIAALLFAAVELIQFSTDHRSEWWTTLPVFMATPFVYWLLRKDRHILASLILITAISLESLLAPLVQSGLGVPNSITCMALICGICIATLPRRYVGRVLLGSLLIFVASIMIDLFGSPARPVAELAQGRWGLALLVLVLFVFFFARELPMLDIRTKIVMGILSTGGIALAIFILFVLYQNNQITNTLANRLDTSVNQLAEEQLVNTAFVETERANQSFEEIAQQVASLAQNWNALQNQKETLSQGTYWDAATALTPLPAGQ